MNKYKVSEKTKEHEIKRSLESKLARYYGATIADAGEKQLLHALQLTIRDILTEKRTRYNRTVNEAGGKRVYYLCMEFLMGRQLKNNVLNLGIEKELRQCLEANGRDLDALYLAEPDPALGNGGLGRLAACYMDSLATLDYPAVGYSILYEYGLFKQRIIDGEQVELPDEWLEGSGSWLVPRPDKSFTVRLGGKIYENWNGSKLDILHTDYQEVEAIPYDLMVSGAGSDAVNVLRLWKAKDLSSFNMSLFSQGEYVKAIQESSNAEIISKVLYPADNHAEGKLLRLTQQYFLVSASLQCIFADYLKQNGSLAGFAEKTAIHLNDTHPTLVIPELMRILMDTYSYSWEAAWDVVKQVVTYTNHTVMPEALETWNEDLFRFKLPRIYGIIQEINRRFCADLWNTYTGDWNRISRMSILNGGCVKMANLCVHGSNTVNGVSALHSDILKNTVFSDFYNYTPEKFTNVTNGIAHRRWLCYSNPGLAELLDESIGTGYRKNPEELANFKKFEDDEAVLRRLASIKEENKRRFAAYAKEKTGISVDPNSLFDVQIKRLHEYKRQLLNCLRILSLYDQLLENPDLEMQPVTFVFAAKAAPGYYMAKEIIKLIYFISKEIESQPKIREKLRVVFMEDYNVSLAEILIPAAEVSEQISLAGKEASGTSCMKLMINGAMTIGTLDGANVEIREAVGDENIYIFGLRNEEVVETWRRGYNSYDYYNNSDGLKRAIKRLSAGVGGRDFKDMVTYLLAAQGVSDPYMCLADFDAYCDAQDRINADYKDPMGWQRKSLRNVAGAGRFAADRAIREYAERIWKMKPIHNS